MTRRLIQFWCLLITGICLEGLIHAADTILTADFSVHAGRLRALHGVNKGPLIPGGIVDVIEAQRELRIPFTRLHDCGWPNPYVVDHHAIFPDPDGDPSIADSYDFRLTDEYIDAVRKTGAEPIYRLGESIEHTSVKRYVHPPADMEKWTAVSLGIIRHYNEGWARGFHHNIRYWEIWNEPENRPAMWSGTDDDYFRLYRTAATAIRKAFPALKVGGPAVGASGSIVDGELIPTEFLVRFLEMCRKENVPLNFFSWHCYTADPTELAVRARALRKFLDAMGFTDTESHLNEWNFLPGNSWKALSREEPALQRQSFYEEMGGARGAAFIATALVELQDAPVDICNLFHGESGGFGIFSEQGVPLKAYQALRSFRGLLETPRRVEAQGAVTGKLAFAAGLSTEGREATLLVSNFSDPRSEFALNWKAFDWTGGVTAEVRMVDATRDFSAVRLENADNNSMRLTLKAPGMAHIRLRPTLGATARRTLSIRMPANRLVFQRDSYDRAIMRVAGTCAWPGASVQARVVDVATGRSGEWNSLGNVNPDFTYEGPLPTDKGWYSLEVRALDGTNQATAVVDRVGVGEVFVVAGHSVAQGGAVNLPGAADERVCTIALPSGDRERMRQYQSTADPGLLPELVGRHFGSDVQPAPAGNGTYFWAAFADRLAREHDVPVMVLNAAFGGSSLEHWAKSARGEPFEHPFVRSSLRMPYIRLQHVLTRYCSVTGLRAILADQGQNDWPEKDEERIARNYRAWIDQARKDTGFPQLAVVINRQTPPGDHEQIRRVQERMIREFHNCHAGPDYDTLGKGDTLDGIHLNQSGCRKAAKLWAEALDDHFFETASPLPPH